MLDQIAMMMNSAYGGRPLRGGNLSGGWDPSVAPQTGGGPREPQQMVGSMSAGGYGGDPRPGMSFGGGGQDFGANMGGAGGARGRQGRQTAEYYPMGMIPTASNMEHVSQFGKTYNYSDTPSMADMARAPWRPETWDPNSDYINQTGGASPNAKWGQMRGGGGRDARSRYLIDRARGRG